MFYDLFWLTLKAWASKGRKSLCLNGLSVGVPSNWRLFANRGHSTIVVYAKPVTAAASHNKQGRAATSSSASTTEIGTSKVIQGYLNYQ